MSESLTSVGLDVGTTSTQLILSRLRVENRAGSFSVPQMEISQRQILYKSDIHFTPLQDAQHIDGPALRELVAGEYAKAGIRKEQVDTGAIIITGETGRKENARRVLQELSGFAGDFVVATAGPHLESVLAAKGAGAVAYSQQHPGLVLHMDIGGGTANLAWIRDGQILATGCLNVGGRLIKVDDNGYITYVSPALRGLTELQPGQKPSPGQLAQLSGLLTQALEMAAGLREKTRLLAELTTREAGPLPEIPGDRPVLSFSGGVADCIETARADLAFGDIGPVLGRAIRESRLCRGPYILGQETIRATVIGAGCHSTQLSGSTVFHRGIRFPLKNLPVVKIDGALQNSPELGQWLRRTMEQQETQPVLALPGIQTPTYAQVRQLADGIAAAVPGPLLVCLEQDMAKALGQALAARTDRPILCLDRVKLSGESFLDVGQPVGPAMPVVVKTLILQNEPAGLGRQTVLP